MFLHNITFAILNYFICLFGCAGSLYLHRLFSSCGKRGLLSSCGAQASHCNGFSCRGAQSLECSGFSSCSSRVWSTGSVIVAHGLSCSTARVIVLDQGSNLSPALAGGGKHHFKPFLSIKSPWRRDRVPTPVFWSGEFHGLYSPLGHKELDRIERLSHFSSLKSIYSVGQPISRTFSS